jgi:lipoprotein NlpD
MIRVGVAVLIAAVLAGCAAPRRTAPPVVERSPTAPPAPRPATAPLAPPSVAPQATAAAPGTYVVKRGDTLYSIALDSGLDYRDLAGWNGIADPNVIREGQVLSLKAPPSEVQVRPITGAGGVQVRPLTGTEPPRPVAPPSDALVTEPKALKLPYSEENLALLSKTRPAALGTEPKPVVAPVQPPKPEPAAKPEEQEEDAVEWIWPASGKIIAAFSDPANKGVDISGRKGEPVQASAGGRVVYVGEGLRGYGKLVIIKHNNTYLSAYAHNDTILVKEGQTVVKGQKIGEIGSTGTDQTKLHFEIRRQGKPVDPLKFLPERKS